MRQQFFISFIFYPFLHVNGRMQSFYFADISLIMRFMFAET